MTPRPFLKRWPLWAAGILLLTSGVALVPVMQQRATLKWIWDQGSGCDYYTEPGYLVSRLPTPVVEWMNDHLGDRWSAPFEDLKNVSLSKTEITAEELIQFRRFEELKTFNLTKMKVSEAMLEEVAKLSHLQILRLGKPTSATMG